MLDAGRDKILGNCGENSSKVGRGEDGAQAEVRVGEGLVEDLGAAGLACAMEGRSPTEWAREKTP